MVQVKYLSNILANIEIPLIACEINFIIWSKNFIVVGNVVIPVPIFVIAETKLDVLFATTIEVRFLKNSYLE